MWLIDVEWEILDFERGIKIEKLELFTGRIGGLSIWRDGPINR